MNHVIDFPVMNFFCSNSTITPF